MLIRKQDFSVLLLYYLGYSRMKNIFLRLQHKPVTRFVTFHDIPPEVLGCFKANMHFLKRSTNVVSIDDFFSGSLSPGKINVVITFDDGYKSWVSNAIPVLQDLELPATFFMSSGFIGLSKKDGAEFMKSRLFTNPKTQLGITSGLTLEDVRWIAEEGFTVGGHTLNHCNLAELRDRIQLRYEIVEDRMRLERITGNEIKYFAYPSGACSNPEINLTDLLRESGYRGAVTTVPGSNNVDTNPYLLHRELTGASMHQRVFRARVYGNYDMILFLKERLQFIKILMHSFFLYNGGKP